jgi:hypothetical protein
VTSCFYLGELLGCTPPVSPCSTSYVCSAAPRAQKKKIDQGDPGVYGCLNEAPRISNEQRATEAYALTKRERHASSALEESRRPMRLVQRSSYCCFQQKAITSWASKICNEQTPVTPSVQRRVQRRDCRACVRARGARRVYPPTRPTNSPVGTDCGFWTLG